MNLFEKLSAITSDLSAVAKNLSVGVGKSSYKAVGEADVLSAVKPLEAKYRVYSYPVERHIIDHDIITTTTTYNGTATESSRFFMRVETIYRFVDIDKPEDYIEITTYGDGIDPQDKAPGKAMTYGDKYALLKAYKIITGDDPDQVKSEEGATKRGRSDVPEQAQRLTITEAQAQMVFAELKRTGIGLKSILTYYKVADISQLKLSDFTEIMGKLKKTPSKGEQNE